MAVWIKVKLKDSHRILYPYAPFGEFEVTYISLLRSFTDRNASYWYSVDSLIVTDDNVLK